jgi:undecaprenyl-diphosphatase
VSTRLAPDEAAIGATRLARSETSTAGDGGDRRLACAQDDRYGARVSRITAFVALAAVTVVSGAAFLVMLWLYRHHHVAGMDRRAFAVLGGSPDGWLHAVAHPAAVVGPALIGLAGLATLVILVRRRRWVGVFVLVAGPLVALRAAHAIKFAEQRPRPPGGLLVAGGWSFPSTDSALAVTALAMAVLLAQLTPDPRRRVALVAGGAVLTIGAGLLFIALRVHFLSDVLAGWALGLGVFAACGLVGLGGEAAVQRMRAATGRA